MCPVVAPPHTLGPFLPLLSYGSRGDKIYYLLLYCVCSSHHDISQHDIYFTTLKCWRAECPFSPCARPDSNFLSAGNLTHDAPVPHTCGTRPAPSTVFFSARSAAGTPPTACSSKALGSRPGASNSTTPGGFATPFFRQRPSLSLSSLSLSLLP